MWDLKNTRMGGTDMRVINISVRALLELRSWESYGILRLKGNRNFVEYIRVLQRNNPIVCLSVKLSIYTYM